MTREDIYELRKSFAVVEGQSEVAALVFYKRLFELEPALQRMFRTPIQQQAHKLIDALSLLVSLLDRPDALRAELEELGARHVRYGVEDRHYAIVGQALLDMLAQVLGEGFTAETRNLWAGLYGAIADNMMRGAAKASPVPART
jgi:hemoglobin-like flavoprotein